MTLTVPAQGRWAGPSFGMDTREYSWIVPLGAATVSSAWGTQYRAIYVPFRVPRRVVVRELLVETAATGTGNYDVGVYDATGVRLVSSGSTAKTAALLTVGVGVTDTTIGPGLYYMGMNADSGTDTYYSLSLGAPLPAASGVLTETLGSVTLPATASWAVDQTLGFIPNIGMLLVTEVD